MKKIRTGGKVKRWHTVTTIQQQTVAEHSWGVAMICRKLWPEDKVLMEAALCHDLGEGLTGDVPWPVKQANFVFKKHLDEIELGNKNMQEVFNRGLRFIDNPDMTTTDEQAIFEFTKPLVERAGESS